MLRYIAPNRLRFQSEFYAITLVLIQITIFVFLFTLVLKGDNNETDEYVHHKEGNNNDVDYIVGSYDRTEVVYWTAIFLIRIN